MDKFFIIVGIFLFVAVMLWAIYMIYSLISARDILRNGRGKKNFTYNYLSVRFRNSKALKNIKLPVYDPMNKTKYIVEIGLIFINRGGLFVINTVSGSGFIDNVSGGETWTRTLNDMSYSFADPFEQNILYLSTVKRVLKEHHIDNIPLHSIVVFKGKKVRFAKRMNGLLTADELTNAMIDLNKDRFLNRSEMKQVAKVLTKASIGKSR